MGLNHLGVVPLGHYPFGQIPFLSPHIGIYSTPIMATLSLPNVTFGILAWYIDLPANTLPNKLKPYTPLALVQPVVPTPSFALLP